MDFACKYRDNTAEYDMRETALSVRERRIRLVMYIQLDGQILYYEKTGSGEPLILLHGNGEDHHIFDELVRAVQNRFTVYVIDTRGHGESATPKEFHYRDFGTDLNNFIRDFHIENPTIVGFSDGAITVMCALLEKKQSGENGGILKAKKLILCGGNLTPAGLRFSDKSKIKKDFSKTKNPLDELMLKEPDITPEQLSDFTMPVTVLAGENDMIKEAETKRIAAAFPNSTLEILKEQTHTSYVIHSDFLKDYI